MINEPLKIKRRGEDGSKVITVRIREDTLSQLDALASETNISRNELINIILSYGVKNIEIEQKTQVNNHLISLFSNGVSFSKTISLLLTCDAPIFLYKYHNDLMSHLEKYDHINLILSCFSDYYRLPRTIYSNAVTSQFSNIRFYRNRHVQLVHAP